MVIFKIQAYRPKADSSAQLAAKMREKRTWRITFTIV